MSLISLVFGIDQRSRIGALTLDALLTEDTELNAHVTEFPVEEGAPISDHIADAGERLALSGTVSGAGISLFSAGGRSKLMAAKEAIRLIHEQRLPVTIVTGMDVYTDMGMVNVRISRSSNLEALTVDCEFRKIRKVQIREADIPPSKVAGTDSSTGAKGKAGTTEAKAGKVSTESQDQVSPEDGMKESTLYGLIRGKGTNPLGGLL